MSEARAQALELARSLEGIADRNALVDAVEKITKLGGFAPRDKSTPIARFESFDAEQREMLRLIAQKQVPHNGAISGWTGAGIPKDTPSLRRWTGVSPPGVLEALVEHQGEQLPRWKVLQDLAAGGVAWPEAERHVMGGADPSARCDLLLEVLANAYGLLGRFGASLGAEHLERAIASAGPDGATWARSRLEAIASTNLDPVSCGALVPKVLSPMLRAAFDVGFVVPSCFDASIEWTPSNRALLASLPEDRRGAMARKTVAGWGAPVFEKRLEALETLADLLVTPEVIRQLETTAKQWPALKGTLPRIKALKKKG
ncbi:MAG: hypothetical protein OHK0013_38050 [Sandaracinaceae bacterium]